jgi:hypothetical protein
MSDKKRKVENSVADLIKPKKKYLYACHCLRCKGTKVDSRTQESHTKENSLWKSKDSRKNQENAIVARKQKKPSIPSDVPSVPPSSSLNLDRNSHHETLSHMPSTSLLNPEKSKSIKSSSYFHVPSDDLDFDENNDDDDGYYPDDDNFDDDNLDKDDNFDEEDENEDDTNHEEDFFASPEIDSDSDEVLFITESLNDSIDSEIIIWVFKYQQRFKLSDIALEALIKFLHIILIRSNKLQFEKFPTSLYKAKKLLKIFQPKMQLAVCTNCHKLHNATNITKYKKGGKVAIMNCLHQEFPNNPIPSYRKQCNNPLSVLKRNKGETIAVPRILYPKPSIRQQLSMLYQ